MIVGVKTSTVAGREGQYVKSRPAEGPPRQGAARHVSIRHGATDTPEAVKVIGRGEAAMSILIEMMRREGSRLQVSRPDIVTKERTATIRAGSRAGHRRAGRSSGDRHRAGGERKGVRPRGEKRQRRRAAGVPHTGARPDRLPVRKFMTDTKGTGIMNNIFELGAVARGDRSPRAPTARWWRDRSGRREPRTAIFNLQERGEIFIDQGSTSTRDADRRELAHRRHGVNAARRKKQTNSAPRRPTRRSA